MKIRLIKISIVSMLLIGVAIAPVLGGEFEEKLLNKMLTAVKNNDYNSFVEDGTLMLQAGITKQMLQGISMQISPRMKLGYNVTYLDCLNQQGCKVYLWKLEYNDGMDDTLIKLVLQNGKVAGFWLQ